MGDLLKLEVQLVVLYIVQYYIQVNVSYMDIKVEHFLYLATWESVHRGGRVAAIAKAWATLYGKEFLTNLSWAFYTT